MKRNYPITPIENCPFCGTMFYKEDESCPDCGWPKIEGFGISSNTDDGRVPVGGED